MDYKGYKLLDKIILVCREAAVRDNSLGANGGNAYYQAYLVDPSNKSQLASAKQWAKWIEYGAWVKDENGTWGRDGDEIAHEPIEFEFENNGFTLELLDCAGGSSQGGKLSFWNCLVSKDGKTFKIGINSDMLLDLLKNAIFDKGACQSPLVFITQKGKVGMTTEGSETYKQCVADRELKKDLKKTAVTKFTFGDILKTPTIEEVYLGTITQYYKFDAGNNEGYCYYRGIDYHRCTVTKLAKPITYHMFETRYNKNSLSDIIKDYENSISYYSYPDLKKTCPKRTIDGKLELDRTEDAFKKRLIAKIYNFEESEKYIQESYIRGAKEHTLYYFLGKKMFGFGFVPFELSEDIMNKIKAAGIRYVEE